MVDKIIPNDLTGRTEESLTIGERFSGGVTNVILGLSDFSEVAKAYAERVGMKVEHADYWLTYILSELETGLAGEKGGWGMTYILGSSETIPPEVMRQHFVADMLWEMYKEVTTEKQLAALKLQTSFDEHGQVEDLSFQPDARNWPLVVRVFQQNSSDPTTFVDVLIEKDAAIRTLSQNFENLGFDQISLANPFSLIDWEKVIQGEGLPPHLQGVHISQERLLTDWYTEVHPEQENEKLPTDFFAKPDIVIGLKTKTFEPGRAFYDPRPTLVASLDQEINAVSLKLPNHVSFDGKNITNAWKALSERKLYKHFLQRTTSKEDLRRVMKEEGLFDSQLFPGESWLSLRNREQGIDGGNTHLIEAALQEKPFEHEGTKKFAELMNIRRIQASADIPDFIFEAIKKFRKQPELLEQYGEIKTSTLMMIALYLVDGRLPGTPIDPEDGRLGITSMGNRVLESLLASREILASNSDELEKHLVRVQTAHSWLSLIENSFNSREAEKTLLVFLESLTQYDFEGFDEEIKDVFKTQKQDGETLSIPDKKIIHFFEEIIPLLEKSKNKNEILFQLLGWLFPTNDNTSPLPNLEAFFSGLPLEPAQNALLLESFRDIFSLTRGTTYSADSKNEVLFRLKPLYGMHFDLSETKKYKTNSLESAEDLKALLKEFSQEKEFITDLEKFIAKQSNTSQYLVLGKGFIKAEVDGNTEGSEKMSPESIVAEVSRLMIEDEEKSRWKKLKRSLKKGFFSQKQKLDGEKLPTSAASFEHIIQNLENHSFPRLGQAQFLEQIYQKAEVTSENIQGLIAQLDIIFGALYEIASSEFPSPLEQTKALNETLKALKVFASPDSQFPLPFLASLSEEVWPSNPQHLKTFILEKRKSVFNNVFTEHRKHGLLYKLQNWEQDVIDQDSARVHRFTSDVLDSGVKTSRVIDLMSKDVKRAGSSISARLSSAQFLEKTANVLAPSIMADLRPLSNVSSLGAVENQKGLNVDAIFPTANAGHNTNVGWGLYGDILTYSCSADDPKEVVEITLPFIRANDDLKAAFFKFLYPLAGSEQRQKISQMVNDEDYLCATDQVNSEEAREQKRKLRAEGHIISKLQRTENFQASANIINRLKMMETHDVFLSLFTRFCQSVLDDKTLVIPEVFTIVENFVSKGFKEVWEAHAQYRLAHFSTEMLNVLFILQSGLTPERSLEELRKLMQINQESYQQAVEKLIDVYKNAAGAVTPDVAEVTGLVPLDNSITVATQQLLQLTKGLI